MARWPCRASKNVRQRIEAEVAELTILPRSVLVGGGGGASSTHLSLDPVDEGGDVSHPPRQDFRDGEFELGFVGQHH